MDSILKTNTLQSLYSHLDFIHFGIFMEIIYFVGAIRKIKAIHLSYISVREVMKLLDKADKKDLAPSTSQELLLQSNKSNVTDTGHYTNNLFMHDL